MVARSISYWSGIMWVAEQISSYVESAAKCHPEVYFFESRVDVQSVFLRLIILLYIFGKNAVVLSFWGGFLVHLQFWRCRIRNGVQFAVREFVSSKFAAALRRSFARGVSHESGSDACGSQFGSLRT